jgi:hypothetical protein
LKLAAVRDGIFKRPYLALEFYLFMIYYLHPVYFYEGFEAA